jgi:hypothetical protein
MVAIWCFRLLVPFNMISHVGTARMELGEVRVSPSQARLIGMPVGRNAEDYRGQGMAYDSPEEDGRPP